MANPTRQRQTRRTVTSRAPKRAVRNRKTAKSRPAAKRAGRKTPARRTTRTTTRAASSRGGRTTRTRARSVSGRARVRREYQGQYTTGQEFEGGREPSQRRATRNQQSQMGGDTEQFEKERGGRRGARGAGRTDIEGRGRTGASRKETEARAAQF